MEPLGLCSWVQYLYMETHLTYLYKYLFTHAFYFRISTKFVQLTIRLSGQELQTGHGNGSTRKQSKP